MDLTQYEMIKNQQDWNEKYNNFVKTITEAFGNSDEPLKIQTVTGTNAVTPMNGASGHGGSIWYVSFNGGKLVTVNIVLTVPDTVVQDTVYGKIPADFAPNDTEITAATYYSSTGAEIGSDGALYTTGSTGGKGGFTRWCVTYIHKD